MPQTYMTTLQFEFVLRACASYQSENLSRSTDNTIPKITREEYESLWSKEDIIWHYLRIKLESDLAASKRISDATPINVVNKPYSKSVFDDVQRTLEILKRKPIGIICINTFREGEVCNHDRAHHVKVHGKRNPICKAIGCPCDNFTSKSKEKPFDNKLGLGFTDFDMSESD